MLLFNPIDLLALIQNFNLEEITVPAKATLLQEGKKSRHLYFIKSGCIRMWTNHNGHEITTQFFFEGSCVASMESLLTNEPSEVALESLQACELYIMPQSQFMELIEKDAVFNEWFQQLIRRRFFYYSKQLLSYIKNKPQERYSELLKKHPKIFQRVPQHYIASYLGITSVSLSRIRNRKS